MNMKIVCATVLFFEASTAGVSAAPINWSSWELTDDGAKGSMIQNGTNIDITYVGNAEWLNGATTWQEGSPAPYTNNSVVDNAPVSGISVSAVSTGNTMNFSEAVIDPVFALYSVGRLYQEVIYAFDQPFVLLSEGYGNWGDGSFEVNGNSLSGYEGHGVIQFLGSISSISWDNPLAEYHHGFTVGVIAGTDTGQTPVPEPATMVLFGIGLTGLTLRRWKENHHCS